MNKAYIRTDALENPEVIENLRTRLGSQFEMLLTDKKYDEIEDSEPFLYYSNPYVRFDNEFNLLQFHKENNFRKITTADKEIISYSSNGVTDFCLAAGSYYHEPKIAPLPILIGTHQRSIYLRLTLSSLIYNLRSSRQEIFIVLTDAPKESIDIVKEFISKNKIKIHAVVVDANLRYAWVNFLAKFYNLKNGILFDDDVLLPESFNYQLPFWTQQMAYRTSTADLVTIKVSKENYSEGTLKWMDSKEVQDIPSSIRWYYSPTKTDKLLPIGGMGMAIDSARHLKKFTAPEYGSSDSFFCEVSKNICIANIPIYHIGANERMDYPDYFHIKKQNMLQVSRYQKGVDLITGEVKVIDMASDWS